MVSDITDKLLPKIEEWQNRPLSAVYPVVFIDAVHFSVRDDGVIRKLAAYVVLGINEDGKKEVLTITIGENESSKYWLSVLNSLKNRGIKDIRDMYVKSSETSARYCAETEKMARYMKQLNSVYEKMITAMTINMANPMMGGAAAGGVNPFEESKHNS